jgi:hypothetical protein
MATLGEESQVSRGVALEGMNPELLLASVRAAIQTNLIDDLDFLSPPAAACALYGLATALPWGVERRELGRRVLLRLHDGDAATFIALATSLALGSRAFDGPLVRARVGLALALPIGTGTRADSLALALMSRRELSQRWLVEPATGALPQRRMAARLLERAAREATRRAVQGDDGGVWLFDSHIVQTAWTHLMSDREPLVWRHIATGRGLLAAVVPRFAEEVERDLGTPPSLSRGRRGAASLAARVAVQPEEALARAREVLGGPILARDPGIAAAMIYGLPRAAEAEPEAAESLLLAAVERGGALAAEALLDLRREWAQGGFGARAAEVARVQLRQRHGRPSEDDGHTALIDLLCEELGEAGNERPATLPDLVFQGLLAFAEQDARAAYDLAKTALTAAEERVTSLENMDVADGPAARMLMFRTLQELDVALLESSTLSDLLCLGAQNGDVSRAVAPLHDVMRRLLHELMRYEREPHQGAEEVPHLTLRMRRLRTLLHLSDIDSRQDERPELRDERRASVHMLFERAQQDAPSAMDRIVHATAARGCDSLVRDETFELSDIVLAAATFVPTPDGFAALSEGSMLPEVKQCTKALAALARTLNKAPPDLTGRRATIESLFDLSRALPAESSPRTEALRSSLLRLGRALRNIANARSLRELAEERRALALLERSVDELVQLSSGARRRLGGRGADAPPTSGHGVWAFGLAVERSAIDDERAGVELTIEALTDSLRAELPPIFSTLAERIIRPLLDLPLETRTSSTPTAVASELLEDRPLPAWLPPARALGGFYVLRALGSGAGGSVFVVKRSEDRHDPHAIALALKVPEYDGSAARSLSEEEFMRMFRQEAGALLAVPSHQNLASFVTFDAGAKPKPILVMELISGFTLERVLAKGEMDVMLGLSLIDGILAGLDAMHSVGVGHLDVKPSNVILRENAGGTREPVLVDFGLSGRHMRPGCCTANYGAPEIWGLAPEGAPSLPMPADVYAAGCLAYEIMTGHVLFDATNEAAMIAAHIHHDGNPPQVAAMNNDPKQRTFASWLSSCLRRDPRQRLSVTELRRALSEVRLSLQDEAWPLTIAGDHAF